MSIFNAFMYNELKTSEKTNKRFTNTENLHPSFAKALQYLDVDITKDQKLSVIGEYSDNNLLNANLCIFVKEYEQAKKFVEQAKAELGVKTSLTGRIAKARYFCDIENAFLVLDVNNTGEKELFSTDRHNFVDFYVSPLDLQTQALILTELEILFNTVYDTKYRLEIVQCYIDRLKYKKNEKNMLIDRLVLYYESYYNNKIYYELDDIINTEKEVDTMLLQSLPFITNKMLKLRLATIYMNCHHYNHALPLYKEMKMFDEVIKCYIGLDMEEQAKEILLAEVQNFSITSFDDKVKLQEIYLLLAALCKDIKYYDLAFETYKTSEAKRLKALFLLDKDIKQSIIEFEAALKINRTEKILFSYACALFQDNRIEDAIQVYKELVFFDPNNYKLYNNLASCYFKIGDVKRGIVELRNAVIYNYSDGMVRTYVRICVDNGMKGEVESLINYYKHNDEITKIIQNELSK